jgi:hypothetical protein
MRTHAERKIIEDKAKAASISNSEFLRTLGLKGRVDRKIKLFPKEILLFTCTLNHLAANINQVAKKRNSLDELNAIERAELNHLSERVKHLAKDIKNYMR